MPHLSPMQWIMALLSIWLMILLMTTSNWWLQSPLFKSQTAKPAQTSSSSWLWL